MFTAKIPFCSITCAPVVPLITHTRMSGGSSESDENAFAVIPNRWSSPRVVITVTPVANAPRAWRKSAPLNSCVATRGSGATSCIALLLRRRDLADLVQALLDHPVEVLRRPDRLPDEPPEGVALHRENRRRHERPDGRHPRCVAQDRHLAEELAPLQRRERALLAVVLPSDLDLAVDDDEELV